MPLPHVLPRPALARTQADRHQGMGRGASPRRVRQGTVGLGQPQRSAAAVLTTTGPLSPTSTNQTGQRALSCASPPTPIGHNPAVNGTFSEQYPICNQVALAIGLQVAHFAIWLNATAPGQPAEPSGPVFLGSPCRSDHPYVPKNLTTPPRSVVH